MHFLAIPHFECLLFKHYLSFFGGRRQPRQQWGSILGCVLHLYVWWICFLRPYGFSTAHHLHLAGDWLHISMVGEGSRDGSTQQCAAAAGVPSPPGAPEHFIHHAKPPTARRTPHALPWAPPPSRTHVRFLLPVRSRTQLSHGRCSSGAAQCRRSSSWGLAASSSQVPWALLRRAAATGTLCARSVHVLRALSACLCQWGGGGGVSEYVRTRLYVCILVFRWSLYAHRI